MMKQKNMIILIVVIAILAVGGFFWWQQSNQPSKLDDFAKCLKNSGEKFYGAFWCPHCQAQKALFGSSEQYLPYIECSTPDSNGELQVCKDAGIQAYPTWKFHDGTSQEGELSLQELADKSGCALPK